MGTTTSRIPGINPRCAERFDTVFGIGRLPPASSGLREDESGEPPRNRAFGEPEGRSHLPIEEAGETTPNAV